MNDWWKNVLAAAVGGVLTAAIVSINFEAIVDALFPTRIIPTGAVIAFDDPDGCPEGWADLSEEQPNRFARRTIVGMDPADNDQTLFGYGETGGEEEVMLTIEQIPSHNHDTGFTRSGEKEEGVAYGRGKQEEVTGINTNSLGINHTRDLVTNSTGGKQAHNNMPPYIALYFCKKG